MKKYLAIGHWNDSENMTSVAMATTTIKNFRDNLGGNGFIPWVIITEKKMETLKNTDSFYLFDEVKKMTSNYRRWNDICEYIEQCFDIMEEKMANA
jgi:hypothetical protein